MPDPVIRFVIISPSHYKCGWCEKAVEALDKEGLPYSIRKLPRSNLLEEAQRAGMTTVPIIYHGVRLVGGFEELEAYLAEMP